MSIDSNNTQYEQFAIDGNGVLTAVNPENLSELGKKCFEAFSGKIRVIDLRNCTNLTTIGECVIFDCPSLVTVILPDSVREIGLGNFGGCPNLKSFTVPEALEEFPAWGQLEMIDLSHKKELKALTDFSFCGNSLILPAGLEEIGDNTINSTDFVYAPASLKKVDENTMAGIWTGAGRLLSMKKLNRCVLNVAYDEVDSYKKLAADEGITERQLIISSYPGWFHYFYD